MTAAGAAPFPDFDYGPQSAWLSELDKAERFHGWVLKTIGALPGPRLLEIGCGIGTYTKLWAEAGYQVTASDINPAYVSAARQRFAAIGAIDVRLEDATSPPQEGEVWDSAVLLDVLEHLRDDVQVLSDIARRLREGGVLAVKVPAHEWLRGSLDDAVGHYRRYSKSSLSQVARDAGYDVEAIKPFNALAMPGWFYHARIRKVQVAPPEHIRMFEHLVPVARLVDQFNPFSCGASLIARLRKR